MAKAQNHYVGEYDNPSFSFDKLFGINVDDPNKYEIVDTNRTWTDPEGGFHTRLKFKDPKYAQELGLPTGDDLSINYDTRQVFQTRPDGTKIRYFGKNDADGKEYIQHFTPDSGMFQGWAPVLGVLAAAAGGAALTGGTSAGAGAALPSGGMAATGTAAPWAVSSPALGSGMYGTGVADMGALMGTSGGAFELGTGLAGVTSADLAASGAGVDWLSHAQKLGKALSSGQGTPQGGSAGGLAPGGTNVFEQEQPQAVDLMPKFSAAPIEQKNDYTALGNSNNINRLAQALMQYKGNIYG